MIDTAIILAAGRGQRMGQLTERVPKPLLSVAGKPIMQYMLELLTAHGVRRVGINLHYREGEIAAYFGDGARFGVEIEYVREPTLTGTAGGVLAVADKLKPASDFYVVAADMLVNFNLAALAAMHQARAAIATLACYHRPREQLQKSGVVLFDTETFEVQRFVERPQNDQEIISQWVNSSVYCFSPRMLDLIEQVRVGKQSIDLPRDVFPVLLQRGERLFAHPFNGEDFYQLGIDTPDRITIAESDISSGKFKINLR